MVLSSDADRRELDWWRLQFGLRFGGKMPKVFSATCGARFVLYVRRPDGSEVPWTGKCETCGGDGYYKGPRLGDEPCSACNGTSCTSPPAASPDPRAVPPPRGAVWSYLGHEWIFTGSMSTGKCDAVTAEGGMGAFSLVCFTDGTLTFVRGPAPETPPVPKEERREGHEDRRAVQVEHSCAPRKAEEYHEPPAPPVPGGTVPDRTRALSEVAAYMEQRAASWGDVQGPPSSVAGALRDVAYCVRNDRMRAPEPPAPPPREDARERVHALFRRVGEQGYTVPLCYAVPGGMCGALCDDYTEELARLDGVLGDLTRELMTANGVAMEKLVLAEAERDAERSRADGHAAEVDRLNKALAEARGQIVNEREAWKKACETSNRYEALAVQWREHYDAAMRREEVSHTNDLVRLAIDRAVTSWGGTGATENIFTAAGFSSAIMKLAGVTGALDGLVVRVILAGRADVEPRPDGCHYRRIATPGKATP